MKQACNYCGKVFEIDEDLTLDDMRDQRIALLRGAYWHIPCSRLIRTGGSVDVEEHGPGKLVPINNP